MKRRLIRYLHDMIYRQHSVTVVDQREPHQTAMVDPGPDLVRDVDCCRRHPVAARQDRPETARQMTPLKRFLRRLEIH